MGMMGHRVKVMQGHTFRLNLSCANPYNADFDGDEMNMHVPQSLCAAAEVKGVMMVHQQILSPQANKPVMGIVQDSLLGAYLMTDPSILLERHEVMDLVHCVSYPIKALSPLPCPAVMQPRALWTGMQVVSFLFPDTLDMCKGEPGTPGSILIRRGRMLHGRLTKSMIGTAAGGVIDTIFRDFGGRTTVEFMGDVQRLVNRWLMGRAFCVGISDCVLDPNAQEKVDTCLRAAMQNADELVREAEGHVPAEQLEGAQVQILSRLLMNTGSIVDKCMREGNAIRTMVKAGSKGNPINLSQICGCVGQQSVEGRRVHCESARRRTLSYFPVGDNTVNGHGLVQNSYALGLTPVEYFFHAMGGREGLVDTAVKTATTGYIQRRQVKAMEDNRCHYDGTVRNAEGNIIQFEYGGDSNDACKLEKWDFPAVTMSDADLRAWFVEDASDPAQEREFREAHALIAEVRRRRLDPVSKSMPMWVTLPVNLPRLMNPLRRPRGDCGASALAREVLRRLETGIAATTGALMRAALRVYLCGANVERMRISEADLIRLEQTICEKIASARVSPGEMVGAIAAQSIGEPCTQMTLNTFHLAGVSNRNVSLGIPRLKEILDHSKNIRTPVNTLHLKKPFCFNKDIASHIADTLPLTKLVDVVSSVELRAEVHPSDVAIQDLGELYDPIPTNCSVIHARLLLNKALMNKRGVGPTLLRRMLRWSLGDRIHVISSETNSVEWVLLVRFADTQLMLDGCDHDDAERILVQRALKVVMDSTVVGGHAKVVSASVREMRCWDAKTCAHVEEYVIDAECNALASFAAIPCVDWCKSTTNHISEALELLGVEAATELLFRQIFEVITFDGTYVDPRHISLISDTMTSRGYVMPLSRHGINRTDTGPLVRCSFEETVEVLYDAALFNETDCGKGVAQNIMTGQMPRVGTGCFEVQLPISETAPKQTRSVIAKSRVRTRTGSSGGSRAADLPQLEYLTPCKWLWSEVETQNELESPFQQPATGCDAMQTGKCNVPCDSGSGGADDIPGSAKRARKADAADVDLGEIDAYRPSSPCDMSDGSDDSD